MYLYTCQPCLEGHHEHCHGTQHPPKGQFGGSKCDCNCRNESLEPFSLCGTCGHTWKTLTGSGAHDCEGVLRIRAVDLERQNQSLRNEIARLNGQTRFFCQCGGVKPELTYKPNLKEPAKHRCETCQEEGTIHIKPIGCHFCQSCLTKIDARIAEINSAKL